MIEVIFKIFLTDYIDFQRFITKRIQKPLLIEYKPAYDHIRWRNNEKEFEAWCNGQTGYPIVDAGMRELNATGFMHNRVRMITASFLTKHLLIDWRWGEAYFAKKLLDFDLSANNGGWQWAAVAMLRLIFAYLILHCKPRNLTLNCVMCANG
jgi:deoxyribodipyrimidine photo-lyase